MHAWPSDLVHGLAASAVDAIDAGPHVKQLVDKVPLCDA
jgi:hypothetical protein